MNALRTDLLGWYLANAIASAADISVGAPSLAAAYGATSAAVVGWLRHRQHILASETEDGADGNLLCH
jgi:hypothetical protein